MDVLEGKDNVQFISLNACAIVQMHSVIRAAGHSPGEASNKRLELFYLLAG